MRNDTHKAPDSDLNLAAAFLSEAITESARESRAARWRPRSRVADLYRVDWLSARAADSFIGLCEGAGAEWLIRAADRRQDFREARKRLRGLQLMRYEV